MRQVIPEVIRVCPDMVAADRLTGRRCVGKSFVASRDPESVKYPAIAGVSSEARRVTLFTKRSDLSQQGIELKQGVAIGPTLSAHSADAARRSGLTWSLLSAPSENIATSAPSRSLAARWNSNMSNRS